MSLKSKWMVMAAVFALGAGLSACDSGATSSNDDAGAASETDSGTTSETDAATSSDTDAGTDPLNAAATCTSGSTWTRGDRGDPAMHPGGTCITCHQVNATREPAAFNMTLAGTVFPTGHEPDDCNASLPSGIQVVVTDSTGATVTMTPNAVGNFSSTTSVTFPITAVVRSSTGERAMAGSVSSGDCNSCHTQDGANGAPGRITIPWP